VIQANTNSRLKSSNEGLSNEPREFGVFLFNGRGWGHGVGMSQWGAYNMAMKGYSYEDILAYYYKNSVLVLKP
jgi:stage II sporulation protein D